MEDGCIGAKQSSGKTCRFLFADTAKLIRAGAARLAVPPIPHKCRLRRVRGDAAMVHSIRLAAEGGEDVKFTECLEQAGAVSLAQSVQQAVEQVHRPLPLRMFSSS